MEGWLWILSGGLIRIFQGICSASPTFLVGLFIAAILRFYFGSQGTRTLFGGDSLRSLPQSWALGMLLPVCSIGVFPILFEMRRAKVNPGALSAFALSAPLFNPLSLLYGLTLSRPLVILMFAFGSLMVVTIVGFVWDLFQSRKESGDGQAEGATVAIGADGATAAQHDRLIGMQRLRGVSSWMVRESAGPSSRWGLVAVCGLGILAIILPWGSMQGAVEHNDPWAPATMAAVSIPVYATPMLTMSQLGMMFQHANSPGAAFVLLVIGTGLNLGTLFWFGFQFGWRPVSLWFLTLMMTVVAIAYAINQPLIPAGVEPAGHTHAFDIYTNPISPSMQPSATVLMETAVKGIEWPSWISTSLLAVFFVAGLVLRWIDRRRGFHADDSPTRSEIQSVEPTPALRYDRVVPPSLVGGTLIVGLIIFSIVMCYAYYPAPNEALEEIRVARAETLTAASAGQTEHALQWLQVWDDWSRRLEVGTYIRHFELRPYQRMQGFLIRKKLELLEHELEHDPFEIDETKKVLQQIYRTNERWVDAFRRPDAERSRP